MKFVIVMQIQDDDGSVLVDRRAQLENKGNIDIVDSIISVKDFVAESMVEMNVEAISKKGSLQ
ncbi:putative alginate lyase family protein [Vibrio virus VPMCC5]|nr:putative alginate lyase family protein [Vibrio virus VPMCC5]